MGKFACAPCLLSFETREEQNAHLKSDLHGYNLKRRIAELEPITPEEFARKLELLDDRAATAPPKKKEKVAKKPKGKARKFNVTSLSGTKSPTPAVSEASVEEAPSEAVTEPAYTAPDDAVEYDCRWCLFDNTISENLHKNIEHMKEYHSFYIHDAPYLTDLKGFVKYLGSKVYEGHQCLYCNKSFRSLIAVRNHMIDVGHSRIGVHLEEQVEEYEPFFDYSSSYKELTLPEEVLKRLPKSITQAPVPTAKTTDEGDDEGDNEEDWEVVEEYEEVGSEEGATYITEPHELLAWDEMLALAGYRAPTLDKNGNLLLSNDKLVPNKKYYRNGKVFMPGDRYVLAKIPRKKDALADKSANDNSARPKLSTRRLENRVRQYQDLRLGVKANTLYRYLARQNMVFI